MGKGNSAGRAKRTTATNGGGNDDAKRQRRQRRRRKQNERQGGNDNDGNGRGGLSFVNRAETIAAEDIVVTPGRCYIALGAALSRHAFVRSCPHGNTMENLDETFKKNGQNPE